MTSTRYRAAGIVIGITVLCLASIAIAEDPYEVAWIAQIGTASYDNSGYVVAVDASDNAYISGQTQGDLGGANAGNYDAFLVKFEAPIPEPATMSLLTLGGVALLRRKEKRDETK